MGGSNREVLGDTVTRRRHLQIREVEPGPGVSALLEQLPPDLCGRVIGITPDGEVYVGLPVQHAAGRVVMHFHGPYTLTPAREGLPAAKDIEGDYDQRISEADLAAWINQRRSGE